MQYPVVVLGTARTPLGGLQGDLSSLAAPQLGAAAIAAAVERSALRGRAVDEVIFGCVLSAGQGQAPAIIGVLETVEEHVIDHLPMAQTKT